MSEDLTGSCLGETHEVFDFEIVVEFRLFFGRKGTGLLSFDQAPNALTG